MGLGARREVAAAKKGQKLGDKGCREPRTGWTSRMGSPGYFWAKQ